MQELTKWASFYMIVGTAAGALVGLQFIVMTLVAEKPPPSASEAGAAFATPTIVHLSTVLLLSAMLSVPWEGLLPVHLFWVILGLSGTIYSIIVARRMRSQPVYQPVFEDWFFHFIMSMIAYLLLLVSAFTISANLHESLLGAALSVLILLFTAIHNAWDGASYYILISRGKQEEQAKSENRDGEK